jgi:hypothetical protein
MFKNIIFKNIILDNNNNNNNEYDNVRRSIIDISSNKLLSINFDEILNRHNIQIDLINMLYHNDETFIEKKIIINELKKKINNYKIQDKKKNIHEIHNLITLDSLIKKLYESKLLCYYCKNNVFIFYKLVRDKQQWTLDRINNLDEHTYDNTVICCYDCNIKRRRTNSKKFLFTKNLKITKEQ